MHPKYLLIDEIEHLKPEYQTMLLSLMEIGILTQGKHMKIRQSHPTLGYLRRNGSKTLATGSSTKYQ